MENSEIEVRYQEDGYHWRTTTHVKDLVKFKHGELGDQPVWLQLILDVAKAGGHLRPLDNGPPDVILWFTLDKDNNLLEITFP
jgi:hypothetical protein